jgi:hypothetical protein
MANQANQNKTFDCLEEKRKVQTAIYKRIKDLSPEEEILFFNKAANRWKERVAGQPVEED